MVSTPQLPIVYREPMCEWFDITRETDSSDAEQSELLSQTLGRNVNRLRKEQELTKKALASLSGISRPFLNQIEGGNSDVRLSHVQQLADVLCVDSIDLLTVPPPDMPAPY